MILLLVLLLLAGPNILPRFLSNIAPQVYEGLPCEWLRTGEDRASHQSLIGRAVENPFSVRVQTSALPTDAAGFLTVRVILVNESLGTVPFVYDPNQVIVGDTNTSGLGVIFSPTTQLIAGNPRQDSATIPEAGIRLLGPRQRCVHTIEFPAGNVLIEPGLSSGTGQVRAYYRNNNRGQIVPVVGTLATPIYPDQGLWVGYVESDSVAIPLAAQ
jgi:hypothetical protein